MKWKTCTKTRRARLRLVGGCVGAGTVWTYTELYIGGGGGVPACALFSPAGGSSGEVWHGGICVAFVFMRRCGCACRYESERVRTWNPGARPASSWKSSFAGTGHWHARINVGLAQAFDGLHGTRPRSQRSAHEGCDVTASWTKQSRNKDTARLICVHRRVRPVAGIVKRSGASSATLLEPRAGVYRPRQAAGVEACLQPQPISAQHRLESTAARRRQRR